MRYRQALDEESGVRSESTSTFNSCSFAIAILFITLVEYCYYVFKHGKQLLQYSSSGKFTITLLWCITIPSLQ